MVSEQEQMNILQHKILTSHNPDEVNLLLDQLEMFGHTCLPCMFEILMMSHNSDVIRSTNFCISRVKQQFVWPDS
jgi:hypothetical protein